MVSAKMGWITALAVAMLVAPSPAQEVEVLKLRERNAQLVRRTAELERELARMKVMVEALKKRVGARKSDLELEAKKDEERRIARLWTDEMQAAAAKAAAARTRQKAVEVQKARKNDQIQAQIERIQVALQRARVARRGRVLRRGLVGSRLPANPLMQGDYAKALQELRNAEDVLQKIHDAEKARKYIDEMSQILMRARRALWEKGKAKGPGPAKGR